MARQCKSRSRLHFDEPAERHVKIANIVLEKAKRLVECGHDVVILLDSITRLATRIQYGSPCIRKSASGGVEANAPQTEALLSVPRERSKTAEAFTIIATVLTIPDPRMDEVILRNLKVPVIWNCSSTVNWNNKRIFRQSTWSHPPPDARICLDKEMLQRMWILRNHLST